MVEVNPSYPFSKWIWIDTCCIDQRSSAEVSESINSMFQWYSQARECNAYLADVRPLSYGRDRTMADFGNSEWFTRGWTLQELLAPRRVIFVTREWEVIGHKCSLCTSASGPCAFAGPLLNYSIVEITGTNREILYDYSRRKFLSIEERMGWMEHHTTTRTEDMAYCLLGLFDVNMPLLYGEGHNALLRLGEQLDIAMRQSRDTATGTSHDRAVLAPEEEESDQRSIALDEAKSQPETLDISLTADSRKGRKRQIPELKLVNAPKSRTQNMPKVYNTDGESSTAALTDGTCKDLDVKEFIEEDDATIGLAWPSKYLSTSSTLARMIEQTKSNEQEVSIRRNMIKEGPFYCFYEPCASQSKYFHRKADLERHILAMHARGSAQLFDCEHPGCHRRNDYGFIRKDNMVEHMREVHKAGIPTRRRQG